ncbi:MAG: lysophospholipase [Alphaproteobacteria bacterium]|nr:lysophospholipase [Alphaproteobacteria bacterium]
MNARRTIGVLVAFALSACAPLMQQPGSMMDAARLDEERFVTSDGIALKVAAWRPDGPPRAVLLALHGFNDYRNAFAEPASEWAKRGILTYAYDQRGHGEAPDPGIWAGTELLVRDAGEMARLLRGRHPDLPLYLLGESMGAAVAIVAMAGDQPPPVDGAVLSAPALWGRAFMPGMQAGTLDFLAHAMPWFPVGGHNTGRVPSDNMPMLRRLGQDRHVQKYNRIDTVYGLVNLMDDAQAAAPRFAARALILYGSNEQLIPHGPVDSFLKKLPPEAAPRQRLVVYPQGFHMLLRDLNADIVRQDIAAWISDPSAPLPSGAERPLRQQMSDDRGQMSEGRTHEPEPSDF